MVGDLSVDTMPVQIKQSVLLKRKMGYSLGLVFFLTIISQFAADGYIGVDGFFFFIFIIYVGVIFPCVIGHHFIMLFLNNKNDIEKIQRKAEIEFASKNYAKALSLYRKLDDLNKIAECVELIESSSETIQNSTNPGHSSTPPISTTDSIKVNHSVDANTNQEGGEPELRASHTNADANQEDGEPELQPKWWWFVLPIALGGLIMTGFKALLMG